MGLLHCCAVTFCPPASVALVLTAFEILQPTCLHLYAKVGNVLSSFVQLASCLLISKISDSLNQKLWEYSEFSSTSGGTDGWLDQCSERNVFFDIARYVGLINFAYGSCAWIYESFRGELSCMFSHHGRAREHQICEVIFGIINMDFWSYQGNVVWRTKTIEQKNFSLRKALQLDIENVFILAFLHYLNLWQSVFIVTKKNINSKKLSNVTLLSTD